MEIQKTETVSREHNQIYNRQKNAFTARQIPPQKKYARKPNEAQENRKPVSKETGFLCCEGVYFVMLRIVNTFLQQMLRERLFI